MLLRPAKRQTRRYQATWGAKARLGLCELVAPCWLQVPALSQLAEDDLEALNLCVASHLLAVAYRDYSRSFPDEVNAIGDRSAALVLLAHRHDAALANTAYHHL